MMRVDDRSRAELLADQAAAAIELAARRELAPLLMLNVVLAEVASFTYWLQRLEGEVTALRVAHRLAVAGRRVDDPSTASPLALVPRHGPGRLLTIEAHEPDGHGHYHEPIAHLAGVAASAVSAFDRSLAWLVDDRLAADDVPAVVDTFLVGIRTLTQSMRELAERAEDVIQPAAR